MLILLIVIALLITAGIWLAVWLASWPVWVGVVVTTVSVLGVVAFVVIRRLRAMARAAALERELLRQASKHADDSRPDRRQEILALQAQMKAAIESLRRSKLGARGGRAALYALPWYTIVGPPAAGKTTALEQSGLAFTTPRGSSPKVRGTAGTRNCDWWFSKDAILLDTAGRFATEDDDRDEWLAFLDTIKRFRPDRPLDGMVVALSVAELSAANDAQIEDLATKLRARIDEVASRLEMVLPIYVMFTKADLVAGFVEYWGDLGKAQRAQPWGATFGLDDERLGGPARAVDEEFDRLVEILQARLIERLPQERVPDVRARVLQFPIEFQSLRGPIASFIEELCRPNPYQDTPILRGFYFTSGTQLGRPLDRVLSNMVRGFDLRLAPTQERPSPPPQSYFVTDLFKTIVFPDRNVAVRSTSRLRRHAFRQMFAVAAAVMITLLAIIPGALSYADNAVLIRSTSKQLDEAARLERSPRKDSGASTAALGVLLDRVQLLETEKSRFRIPGWIGARAAPKLYEPVLALYLQRVRAVVDGPVREQVKGDVRAVADLVRTDAENFQSAYDDLKLYVMMTSVDHLKPEWASEKLAEKWARAIGADDSGGSEKLVAHAKYYLDGLAANPAWAWTTDEAILARARSRLSQQPLEELQYGWLVSSAKGVPPIRAEKIFYGPVAQYVTARGDVQVPGVYTKAGWEKVRAALESESAQLVIEPWVLGGATKSTDDVRKASTERLREIYFQRYERAWSDLLAGLNVQTPGDIRMAVDELRAIAESDGPYARLFRTLADNASLDMTAPSLVGKALEKGKETLSGAAAKITGADAQAPAERAISPVERHFKPLIRFAFGESGGSKDGPPSALNQYLAQLTTLEVALSQLMESKSEPTAEFQSELSRTAGVIQRLLGGFDPATRLVLDPFLMNPIRGSRAGVANTEFAALEDKWKAEVWETYNTKLASRYPFADVAAEVTVPEFSEFFRPQTGVLWKYYEKNLQDKMERSGSSFAPKQAADPIPFRPDFLRCLGVAQEITDAIFGAGPEPSVPFSLRMHSVGPDIAEVTFRVDGQAIVYRNEPERWLPAQWPGKGTPKGAVLQVKGSSFTDEIPRDGDFGLFRLLAAGGIKPVPGGGEGGPLLTASWNLTRAGQPPVRIEFKPAKEAHPFARDFFRRLRCPAEIMQGAAPQPGSPRP
jgi:type VI secretion system protein ImpL